MEVFEQIRRDHWLDGLSIRELAERHRVHRRTVRQALASAFPPPRKQYPTRPRPAMDPYAAVVDAILIADRQAPKKTAPYRAQDLAAAGCRTRRQVFRSHGLVVCHKTANRVGHQAH